MRAAHAFVSGLVQGVYFRQSTRQRARALGLTGWVRNLRDGRVEVWVQGDPARVEDLVGWLWEGPPRSRVTGVESDDVEPDDGLQDFLVVN